MSRRVVVRTRKGKFAVYSEDLATALLQSNYYWLPLASEVIGKIGDNKWDNNCLYIVHWGIAGGTVASLIDLGIKELEVGVMVKQVGYDPVPYDADAIYSVSEVDASAILENCIHIFDAYDGYERVVSKSMDSVVRLGRRNCYVVAHILADDRRSYRFEWLR